MPTYLMSPERIARAGRARVDWKDGVGGFVRDGDTFLAIGYI